jgi:ABC-2 type transport system ATP-binding protein
MADAAVEVRDLAKRFGQVMALDGIDFDVPAGTVFGLLGPNGAGKTTAVRVLTTIIAPDRGTARVLGYDVVRDAGIVRLNIGLAGQSAAVDANLTGSENLRLIGRLAQMPVGEISGRAAELLGRFDLVDAADRPVRTYSGGMRRRLDVAASLVHRPPVLFLDEPTTGLDLQSRGELWQMIRELVDDGTTVMLTTQYLEEADRLANSIVVIDHGKEIARGTADELKSQIGGERLELTVSTATELPATVEVLRKVGTGEPSTDDKTRAAGVAVTGGSKVLIEALRQLDAAGVVVQDVGIRRPTLDDVFLSLTGHAAEDEADPSVAGAKPGRRARKEKQA